MKAVCMWASPGLRTLIGRASPPRRVNESRRSRATALKKRRACTARFAATPRTLNKNARYRHDTRPAPCPAQDARPARGGLPAGCVYVQPEPTCYLCPAPEERPA